MKITINKILISNDELYDLNNLSPGKPIFLQIETGKEIVVRVNDIQVYPEIELEPTAIITDPSVLTNEPCFELRIFKSRLLLYFNHKPILTFITNGLGETNLTFLLDNLIDLALEGALHVKDNS